MVLLPPVVVSIDKAGRVAIPKDIRDRLSLGADAELDIDGLPVLERVEGHATTGASAQRWRDADQR